MNITIITSYLPWPLNSGGAQAQYNMIDVLRKRHHITLIFPINSQNKQKYANELQNLWPDVNIKPYSFLRQLCYPKFVYEKAERAFKLMLMPHNERFIVQRNLMPYGVWFSKDFVKFVNRTIEEDNSDIVQAEFYPCLPLARYLITKARKIFVHHELRYIRNERILSSTRLTKKEEAWMHALKKEEMADLQLYDTIITLTKQDKLFLQHEGINVPIKVSPAAISTMTCPYTPWNHKLSFVGGHLHIPNQEGINWYIQKVLPLLKNKYLLEIIGGGWPSAYNSEYVRIMGFVENLQSVVCGSIMIIPILSGSGMRMKILEAAAMSLPIVTTTVGVEGLKFVHNESCIIADTPQEFANAIERLASNDELCKQLGTNANSMFNENYSKESLSKLRNQIYES
jgi:glycosyltransferase involved in cell wall biosynthesis